MVARGTEQGSDSGCLARRNASNAKRDRRGREKIKMMTRGRQSGPAQNGAGWSGKPLGATRDHRAKPGGMDWLGPIGERRAAAQGNTGRPEPKAARGGQRRRSAARSDAARHDARGSPIPYYPAGRSKAKNDSAAQWKRRAGQRGARRCTAACPHKKNIQKRFPTLRPMCPHRGGPCAWPPTQHPMFPRGHADVFAQRQSG